MQPVPIHTWPFIVAVLIKFVVGWLWYSPVLFLKQWQALSGVTSEQIPLPSTGSRFSYAGLCGRCQSTRRASSKPKRSPSSAQPSAKRQDCTPAFSSTHPPGIRVAPMARRPKKSAHASADAPRLTIGLRDRT